jgi:hypothetical protein
MSKNKPVLMIHEVKDWMLDLPLEKYILTFDDGLYSQYYYFDHFKKIPTEKIYFISSDIICTGTQSTEFPCCRTAHEKAFSGNKEDYMTLDQIKELMADPWVTIGGHSHNHNRIGQFRKVMEKLQHIKTDTELMLEWFEKNLDFRPKHFCYPYNDDYSGLYPAILKHYNFTNFYGKDRIAIESLRKAQQSQTVLSNP